MLGEHGLADKLSQGALDGGGPVPGSVHGFYASFLFDQGRATEAFEMINEAGGLDPAYFPMSRFSHSEDHWVNAWVELKVDQLSTFRSLLMTFLRAQAADNRVRHA
ncbi:MAG TPA: hypothetical protein VFC19_24770 [Candidatus Limnocylindrales bacterium]|nr:hypothetical protein [Candidatus Limnocylindrales bacterium]